MAHTSITQSHKTRTSHNINHRKIQEWSGRKKWMYKNKETNSLSSNCRKRWQWRKKWVSRKNKNKRSGSKCLKKIDKSKRRVTEPKYKTIASRSNHSKERIKSWTHHYKKTRKILLLWKGLWTNWKKIFLWLLKIKIKRRQNFRTRLKIFFCQCSGSLQNIIYRSNRMWGRILRLKNCNKTKRN